MWGKKTPLRNSGGPIKTTIFFDEQWDLKAVENFQSCSSFGISN